MAATQVSRWFFPFRKIMMIAKKEKNITKRVAGPNPSPDFRQVGKCPPDRSSFKVQHLGDQKQ